MKSILSSKPYIKHNLSLAWPLALNALLMQSMLMIDTLLISPLGEGSLASLGIATTIIAFVLGTQMALANGTQLVLSRAVGSGAKSALNRGFWSGMLINLAIGGLFFLIIALFDRPLVIAIADQDEVVEGTLTYLNTAKFIILFNAITQVMIALFNSLGKTKLPFKGYLLELPINVLSSCLLIFGVLGMEGIGLQGAAWGSLIGILVRMGFLLFNIKQDRTLSLSIHQLDASLKHNAINHFKEIFPVAANVTMLSTGATIYMLILAQLPLTAYVAITVIMPWVRAGNQFITAWAHSSAITISQAIGSRKLDDLRINVDTSIFMAVAISLISALLFWVLSLFLPYIYPTLESTTYTALSVIAPLYIFLPLVRGYNTVHGHILRALGKTTAVFKINFTGQWVISIPLCAWIVIGLEGSIFWAFAVFPTEEIIKMLPFRYLARKTLDEFDAEKAQKLMYD